DILMAFKRWFDKKGCDVYVANTNRNITHYYLRPKENKFKIDKLPYITNPDKTMNFTDDTKLRINIALKDKAERLKARIDEYKGKQKEITDMYNKSESPQQKFQLKSQYEHFEDLIIKLTAQLRVKQENYFKDKRPAFFYMENDPIPKDFYEYMSPMDCKIVDNLVSRAKSQPPNKKAERDIDTIKMLVIGAAIAAAVAGFFAFRNNSMIAEICRITGAACNI
ncbi:hypothetical protein LCGC14_2432560, partial [marine sediment metagenome]